MRQSWPLLALAVVLGCGGGGDDPASPRGTRYTFDDPRGDTLAIGNPESPAHDVLRLEAARAGDTLLVTVRFAAAIAPYSEFAPNSVLGVVDLDMDADRATGEPALADDFGATSGVGTEWSLHLEDSVTAENGRRAGLVERATRRIHWVPARFERTAVTARIPLALMDAASGDHIRLVGVVGQVDRVSDIVPNEGGLELVLP